MEANQVAGDGISPVLAGMSKSQLYDIMGQMKTLIEQNKQQARHILIQNPPMTRALFQAQIMLGMVQPAQTVTTTPSTPPNSQPPAIPGLASNTQAPAQVSQNQIRKQQPNQAASSDPQPHTISPSNSLPQSKPISPPNSQPQSVPSHLLHAQQPTGHLSNQPPPMPQSSQIPGLPQMPQHTAASQPISHHQSHMPSLSTQAQQPIPSIGGQYMPLQQPPLPPQPRPQMPAYAHQGHAQMGPNMGYQHPSGPQIHPSQHMFHSGAKPSAGLGPSFQQGQLQHSNQSLPPSSYQAGGPPHSPHLGMEFNQGGSSKQPDRGSNWLPGPPENPAVGHQLPGPPPFPGQGPPGNQLAPPAAVSPEVQKALLEQVMNLTPEEINLLPPDQRNTVLQLQHQLRR